MGSIHNKKKPSGITTKQISAVLQLHARGLTHRQIAHNLNMSKSSVTRVLFDANGGSSNMKPYRKKVISMIRHDYSPKEIMAATECSYQYQHTVRESIDANMEILSSFKSIGLELGLTKETTRRVYVSAMKKIQIYCEDNNTDIPGWLAFCDGMNERFVDHSNSIK